MKNKLFWCYHGSPGTINDFDLIKNKLSSAFDFLVIDRYFNTHLNSNEVKSSPDFILTYSFGCTSFLKTISDQDLKTVKKIYFISPYIFDIKPPSFILKSILNSPIIGDSLLKKVGPKKIEDFLNKSSAPLNPPKDYLNLKNSLCKTEILKFSTLEKNISEDFILKQLEKIAKLNIPIEIIYGNKDQTSLYEVQVRPLTKFKNINLKTLDNQGHALLWTAPDEIIKCIKDSSSQGEKMENKFGYYDGAHELNNVAAFLADHLKKFPDRKILTWVHPEEIKKWNPESQLPIPLQSITVKELDYLVGILAFEFNKLGILKDDRVILFLPMSLYMYASMFALQKIGAIPTFLDSWARRDQMGVSAKVADPKAMISAHRAFEYLKDVPEIQNIKIKVVAGEIPENAQYDARLEVLLKGKEYKNSVPVEKEHTALITFTTGSSGTPKGADRSHRFLAAQHYALNRHLPYLSSDKDLPVFPIFSLNNLAAGVETVIPAIDVGLPNEKDSLILFFQMKSAQVTCTTLSPSLFNGLSDFCIKNNLKLDFLKRIVTGGAPISRGDVEKMKSVAANAEILVLYGSTEVEPMAHIEAKEWLSLESSSDPEIEEAGVNVGHLDEGLKYKFLKINKDAVYINQESDWNDQIVKENEVGELIVAGEHVCEKYFNNEEAFFRAKIKDHQGVIWHRTGDLGLVDQKHHLWIVGRVHNAIKRGTEWFFPVRPEIVMKKISFIDKAAYLGINDSQLGQKTYAVFTLKNNIDPEQAKKEVDRLLKKNQFITDEILIVDNIPMDPRHHSKVEYDVLRKQLEKN